MTSAVVLSSLDNKFKLNEKWFVQRIPLLERYLDGGEPLQVQCLIGIQILVNQLEHPSGNCPVSVNHLIDINHLPLPMHTHRTHAKYIFVSRD